LLSQAMWLSPDNPSTQRRLAETEFALGDRIGAATLLPPITLEPPEFEVGSLLPVYASPLLLPGRVEHYLVVARQQTAKEQWKQAVWAYRWALALGGQNFTVADHTEYFSALAEWHAEQAEAGVTLAYEAYLAGKYFERAGDWTTAEHWLQRSFDAADWRQLSDVERARVWTYSGLVHEQSSNFNEARLAYEEAAASAPALPEPQLRLLALLQRQADLEGAIQVATRLEQLGPTYRLDQLGDEAAQPEPFTTSKGWTLAGYDVDEESLETGGQLLLWLWWQAPPNAKPERTSDWLQVGDYWVESQWVINFASNAGFEWGDDYPNGLPQGFLTIFTTTRSDRLTTTTTEVGQETSHVLQLEPGSDAGIKSFPVWVNADGLYLMAGWLRNTGGTVTALGRECFEHGDVDYSVAQSRINTPPLESDSKYLSAEAGDAWTHVAILDQLFLDRSVNYCHLYLQQRFGTGEFDRILFATVLTP
jgi:tetratricopeptide (TPR) repeat protein